MNIEQHKDVQQLFILLNLENQSEKYSMLLPEHMLKTMLTFDYVTNFITSQGGCVEELYKDLQTFILENVDKQNVLTCIESPAFNRVVGRAITYAMNKQELTVFDLLYSLLEEGEDSFSVYFMAKQNIDALKLKKYLTQKKHTSINSNDDCPFLKDFTALSVFSINCNERLSKK
jgi:ATP-dependent Clp protease ATP-binding subunit ClpA